MKYILFLSLILASNSGRGQSTFTGTFTGNYNGEVIILKLNQLNSGELQGLLSDASSNYNVIADIAGNRFAGDATHTSLELKPAILGELKKDILSIILLFDIAGTKSEVKVDLQKDMDTDSKENLKVNKSNTIIQIPKNATNDSRLIGVWIKEENYNSGSGDNFMGSTFSQSMTFFQDGTVADGGSTATISGGNYFGQSQNKESIKTPGVVWYTRANQLYLGVDQNGIQQEVHLGRFFIENGNMLITGTNGTKMLLHKK